MSSAPRAVIAIVCLTVSILVLSQGMTACDRKEPLIIGFVGGLSGRVADLGIAGRNGVMLAVEDRNARGGVANRHVELLVEDDRQDPEAARAAVLRLIDQGSKAIIGHMTSAMSVATVPLVNQHQIVMVSPTTTTTDLSGIDDYFFRVIDTTKHYAMRSARYFIETQGVKKTAIIYDLNNEAYSVSYLNSFRGPYEDGGGSIVTTNPFQSGSMTSYLSLVKKTLTPETEGVLIISSALDAALICQQIRKARPDVQIIVSEWSATEQFISMGGSAVEGVLAHQYFDRDSTATNYLAFRQAYIARFGESPGFASVGGYDAANLVLTALERQPANKSLKETILELARSAGLQGQIVLDAYGDTSRETHLSVVRGGKFITLD